MRIIVISPDALDLREIPVMEGLFAAGLERYHVRKPAWSLAETEAWLRALPVNWRPRIVLHQHHELVKMLGLAGRHEKGESQRASGTSRSCHDLVSLRRYLRAFDQVLFGPIFPSISKQGYGPAPDFPWNELTSVLKGRGSQEKADVLAIGGVTAEGLERCHELGFDGAAVLGALWESPDPVAAYGAVIEAASKLGGARHAA
jgi:thiamine-phosphate pyrophosphorylase